jgi:hypothetical protein
MNKIFKIDNFSEAEMLYREMINIQIYKELIEKDRSYVIEVLLSDLGK